MADLIDRLIEREKRARGEDRILLQAALTAVRQRDAMAAEIKDLRESVIAFGAPWAVEYARDHGLPPGHLAPTHYDILARAGARMDSFTRAAGFASTEGR